MESKEVDSSVPSKKDGDGTPSQSTEQKDEQLPGHSGKIRGIFHRFVESFEDALHSVTDHSSGHKPILSSPTIEGVVDFMRTNKPQNIIVMTGAGISTSAGIPDFRSPETGLYNNLQEYNLRDPMDIFNIGFFMKDPEPFFKVAKNLFPTNIKPTPAHHFVRLLEKKGFLRRWFTQNIDALEYTTGIPEDKIVEAHGSYRTSTCMKCKKKYDQKWIEGYLAKEQFEVPKCDSCGKTVKPDITFFGENLPKRFFSCAINDFPKCDLLIIMGTSLVVQPFASMVSEVSDDVPRLLINLEPAGRDELRYGRKGNTRDVFMKSTCDDGVRAFATMLDWEHDLEALIAEGEVAYRAKMGKL